MADDPVPNDRLIADYLLRDVEKRHAYQHEFSLAGFKALILLNGGAIISLLTYVGHNTGDQLATHLSAAFIWYVVGLVSVVVAHIAAYFSQGSFLNVMGQQAFDKLGVEYIQKRTSESHAFRGYVAIALGVALTVLSLLSFVAGSYCAMRALT